jgi:hypothetical protein
MTSHILDAKPESAPDSHIIDCEGCSCATSRRRHVEYIIIVLTKTGGHTAALSKSIDLFRTISLGVIAFYVRSHVSAVWNAFLTVRNCSWRSVIIVLLRVKTPPPLHRKCSFRLAVFRYLYNTVLQVSGANMQTGELRLYSLFLQ